MYEDPDTFNFFFARAPPQNRKKIEQHRDFCWMRQPTLIAKLVVDRCSALLYLTKVRSTLLRVQGQWESYRRDRRTVYV